MPLAVASLCCTLAFPSARAYAGALDSLKSLSEELSPNPVASARPSARMPTPRLVRVMDPEIQYESMYAAGRAPQSSELVGNWNGQALAFARQGSLPRVPLLEHLISAVSLRLWEGKTFLADGAGVNRFLDDRLKLFRFTTEVRPSLTGIGEALALNYSANPYPVSAVRDEVRLLADGRLLGRAYLHAPNGKDYFLFFFMLNKSR